MIYSQSTSVPSTKASTIVTDPLTGSSTIHGQTNKRPKAYAGEVKQCPWDEPKKVILTVGSAFITINDFPAIDSKSLSQPQSKEVIDEVYSVKSAHGECLMVIYSNQHDAHWLTLSKKELYDVVKLWVDTTKRSKSLTRCVFTEIFENDGPTNTMLHPHGQQYNFGEIPPNIQSELERCNAFFNKTKKNLLQATYDVEVKAQERIVYHNSSFIAFIPMGARWPYQVRVLPKRHVLWLTELSETEQKDLAEIITAVRKAYKKVFSKQYKPTVMMTIQQAPFDNEVYYRKVYGLRIEFYNTALSQRAEKLMFSIENATGYSLYSDRAEDIAKQLRKGYSE